MVQHSNPIALFGSFIKVCPRTHRLDANYSKPNRCVLAPLRETPLRVHSLHLHDILVAYIRLHHPIAQAHDTVGMLNYKSLLGNLIWVILFLPNICTNLRVLPDYQGFWNLASKQKLHLSPTINVGIQNSINSVSVS